MSTPPVLVTYADLTTMKNANPGHYPMERSVYEEKVRYLVNTDGVYVDAADVMDRDKSLRVASRRAKSVFGPFAPNRRLAFGKVSDHVLLGVGRHQSVALGKYISAAIGTSPPGVGALMGK